MLKKKQPQDFSLEVIDWPNEKVNLESRYKKKQWQQTKKGEFWQLDNEKSFEAISSEFFAKDEEEEQYFCKRFFT